MINDMCQQCKDEGRGTIIAHFKADPEKGTPAMCWDHKQSWGKAKAQQHGDMTVFDNDL